MPYGFSPGSPPWKSSNSSSDRRGRDERFEGSSSSGSQSYDMSRYGLDRSPRPRRAHPPERHPQNPRTRDLHRRQRTPEPEDEDDDPEEIYEEEMYDEDYSEEEDLPPPPSRSRRPQPPPAEARRLETKGRRPRRAPESDYTYTPDPYKNQQHGDRYLRPAYSAANLTLAESDLYADRTAVSTNVQTVTRSRSHGRYERPDTPTSQHSQRSRKSAKKQPAPPAPDGSDQWCTRTVEPLARIRLNTVIKSLQESDESLCKFHPICAILPQLTSHPTRSLQSHVIYVRPIRARPNRYFESYLHVYVMRGAGPFIKARKPSDHRAQGCSHHSSSQLRRSYQQI